MLTPCYRVVDGTCAQLHAAVNSSSCLSVQAVSSLAASAVAYVVYGSQDVSAACIEWTRALPRAAFTCALAVSAQPTFADGALFPLGGCADECDDALELANNPPCSDEELALLPENVTQAASSLLSLAGAACTAVECLALLPPQTASVALACV